VDRDGPTLEVSSAAPFPKRWDERLAAWFFLVSALAFALAERGTFSG
jgi:hypothetical protein